MVKISILITAYNLEKYIAAAIESVLAQKGEFDIEVLIGDDGSSDNTVSVINSYIEKNPDKITLYQMPREKDVNYNRVERSSANRLNLLANATGDYICFLDGDDFYIDNQKFQKQINILENDKTLSMCTHNVVMYYGEDTSIDRNIEGPKLSRAKKCHRWTLLEYWPLEFIQANAMLYRNYYNNGNDFFKTPLKEVIESSAALKNTFDDNNITLAFFMYGDMYYISDVMGAYRQSADSSWNAITEFNKHCSNMIGYSIERQLLNNTACINVSIARHYKDFAYILDNVNDMEKDNCQPFYDTAVKYEIEPALSIYNIKAGGVKALQKLTAKSKSLFYKAKLKRALQKKLGIY